MGKRHSTALPHARTQQLVVQELPEETLVYDLLRHKAHCLNRASAIVWKHCDGKLTVGEAVKVLGRELGVTVGEDVVWLALGQLRRFHLLEKESLPDSGLKVSRRDLVRKYLPAALTLPLILSIASPNAVQAASACGTSGQQCNTQPCCASAPFCVGPVGNKMCQANPP